MNLNGSHQFVVFFTRHLRAGYYKNSLPIFLLLIAHFFVNLRSAFAAGYNEATGEKAAFDSCALGRRRERTWNVAGHDGEVQRVVPGLGAQRASLHWKWLQQLHRQSETWLICLFACLISLENNKQVNKNISDFVNNHHYQTSIDVLLCTLWGSMIFQIFGFDKYNLAFFSTKHFA